MTPFYFYMGDLLIARSDGGVQFVEVKCESSYTRASTPNLAIERYSDMNRQKAGGPWSTEADFYAHIYTDGLLVIINRRELVAWLDRELATAPQHSPSRFRTSVGRPEPILYPAPPRAVRLAHGTANTRRSKFVPVELFNCTRGASASLVIQGGWSYRLPV